VIEVEIDTDSASLQQSARRARYAGLARWLSEQRIRHLATAHHIDDQAETLLMRLLRGSGVAGLAGIRRISALPGDDSHALLLRPLLGWRRSELRAVVDAAGLRPIEDPSNDDRRFDRARIRQQLAEADWIDPVPLARSAAALAAAEEALAWSVARLDAERVIPAGGGLGLHHDGLPAELKRRLVAAILHRLQHNPSQPRGEELGRLLQHLEQGGTATLAGVKCSGGADLWLFEPEQRRRR
jgi:tRNA(Ile)-lysidine synthase